jgi:L,D-transpeptidase YcbB
MSVRKHIAAGTLALFCGMGQVGAAESEAQLSPDLLLRALADPQAQGCAQFSGLRSDTAVQALARLYGLRNQTPLWQDEERRAALRSEVAALSDDGLILANYAAALREEPVRDVCDELAISFDYLLALEHLMVGRLPQQEHEALWVADALVSSELPDVVALAVEGLSDLPSVFDRARPALGLYRALRAAYVRMQQQAASWGSIPAGPLLRPDMADPRLRQLRARLAAEGYIEAGPAPASYDLELQSAVRRFQEDQGLQPDAVVGPLTLVALNTPRDQRLQQVRINLERLRWLNAQRQDYLLLVNIAASNIRLYRGEVLVWQSRVQTGRPARPTPTMISRIDRITLNPSWTVPPTILEQDILPQLRRDPGYLQRLGMVVLDPAGQPLDPSTLDWRRPGQVLLRQPPGPTNPLGRLVFRFANPLAIFLHDTPSQHLFARADRHLSSGCVRVEDAHALAELLLEGQQPARLEALAGQLDSGLTHELGMSDGPQVILAYWTVEVREDGRLLWSPDPYRRDPGLISAFAQLEASPQLVSNPVVPVAEGFGCGISG